MKFLSLFVFGILIYLFLSQNNETPKPVKSNINRESKIPQVAKQKINRSFHVIKKSVTPKKLGIDPKKNSPVPRNSKLSDQDPNILPEDEEGNLYIQNVLLDQGYMISHGDLILGPDTDISKYQDTSKSLKLKKPVTWPKGLIPYVIQSQIPNQDRITKTLDSFKRSSKIRFIKRTNEADYVVFKKGSEHCYSSLGMIGGKQFIHLSDNCRQKEIFHELMHTLGFLHEQNRMDRDEFVDILWENIKKENHLQFKKISNNFLDLSKFEFDYSSIMLYGSTFFSTSSEDFSIIKVNGDPIINNDQSSPSNQDWTKINHLYP